MDRRGVADLRPALLTSANAAPTAEAVTARRLLASWLRAGRQARKLTLAEVAKVTKIQARTLEHLEMSRFDQLPADVFVRGFVRSYARCVGLDPDDAVRRYSECGTTPGPVATPEARALIDSMAGLVPTMVEAFNEAAPAQVEPIVAIGSSATVQLPAAPARKKQRGKGRRGRARQRVAQGTAPPLGRTREAHDVVPVADDAAAIPAITPVAADHGPAAVAPAEAPPAEPTVEPAPPAVAPMRRTTRIRIPVAIPPAAPRLVIDDANPELAATEQQTRSPEQERRSFLPPDLIDNLLEGERPRQGGLTLAVIILIIAATLTLSYLMRRPSSAGEGMTAIPTALQTIS